MKRTLLRIELELVKYLLFKRCDQLLRTRLYAGVRGIRLALAWDFTEAFPALVLGNTSDLVLLFIEIESLHSKAA
jgi:hypothetical protein